MYSWYVEYIVNTSEYARIHMVFTEQVGGHETKPTPNVFIEASMNTLWIRDEYKRIRFHSNTILNTFEYTRIQIHPLADPSSGRPSGLQAGSSLPEAGWEGSQEEGPSQEVNTTYSRVFTRISAVFACSAHVFRGGCIQSGIQQYLKGIQNRIHRIQRWGWWL